MSISALKHEEKWMNPQINLPGSS